MNLLLFAAFNLILTLIVTELDSDQIVKENVLKALEKEEKMLRLINAENELWKVAEISGKNNLSISQSFSVWRDVFPEIEIELKGTCAKKEVTSTDIARRIVAVPEKNMTTTVWASGCLNEKLILSYGDQERVIYLGGSSGFGEEKNWTLVD